MVDTLFLESLYPHSWGSSLHCPIRKSWEGPSPHLRGFSCYSKKAVAACPALPRSRGFSSSMPFLRIRIFGSPPARGTLPCLLFFMFSKPLARNTSPGSAMMVLCLLSGPCCRSAFPARGGSSPAGALMPRPSPPLMGFFHRKWLILYFLKAFPPLMGALRCTDAQACRLSGLSPTHGGSSLH